MYTGKKMEKEKIGINIIPSQQFHHTFFIILFS